MAEILVESMVSSRTKEGMVTMMLVPDDGAPTSVQVTPAQAREIGAQMIEAATVAIDDELMHEIAGPSGVVAMRHLRQQREEKDAT